MGPVLNLPWLRIACALGRCGLDAILTMQGAGLPQAVGRGKALEANARLTEDSAVPVHVLGKLPNASHDVLRCAVGLASVIVVFVLLGEALPCGSRPM
jgi:hypothetical protein